MATPVTKKPATRKPAAPAGDKSVRKPRAAKEVPATAKAPRTHKEELEAAPVPEKHVVEKHIERHPEADLNVAAGRYVYAVGRRKTSVANIRLFAGKGKSTINNKDFEVYFGNNKGLVERATKPLQLTGLEGRTYVYVNVKGGGINSQSQAIAHGIATAIATSTPDFRKVLKKNGTLTRDSRMKERKKPGLKRARRGPQWAKR